MSAPTIAELLEEARRLREEVKGWRTGYEQLKARGAMLECCNHALDVLAAVVEAQAAFNRGTPKDYTEGHNPEAVAAFMRRFTGEPK